MADEAQGAAAGAASAGQGAGASPANTGSAGSVLFGGTTGTAGAADPAAGAGAAKPAAATGTTGTPDYKWAGDDAAQALAQKKGWTSAGDALKSYTELEGLLGGEKLPLPKNEGDKAGWDRVYKTLGRPDTPDGYQIPIAEGGSKELAGEFQGKAHELGLSAKQATELAKWFDAKGTNMSATQTTEMNARIDADIAAVKTNWGANFNQNAEIARRGADMLGLDKAAIDALETSTGFGHKKLMDTLLKIGQTSTEGRFVQGEGSKSFAPMTKENAQARLNEIKGNPQERSEALKEGSAVNKEVDRLDKIIAGFRG